MTTPTPPTAAPDAPGEDIAEQLRIAATLLRSKQRVLQPYTGPLSICEGTYASLDEMVDLIRAKLAHSDSLTLHGVDGDDRTICFTGNNEQGEAHAEWIAILFTNADRIITDMERGAVALAAMTAERDAATRERDRLREAITEWRVAEVSEDGSLLATWRRNEATEQLIDIADEALTAPAPTRDGGGAE